MLTWYWVPPSLRRAFPGAYKLLAGYKPPRARLGFVAYSLRGLGGPSVNSGLLPNLPGGLGGASSSSTAS